MLMFFFFACVVQPQALTSKNFECVHFLRVSLCSPSDSAQPAEVAELPTVSKDGVTVIDKKKGV